MKPRTCLSALDGRWTPPALRPFPNTIDLHAQLGSISKINACSPSPARTLLAMVWGQAKAFELVKAPLVTEDQTGLGTTALA